MTNWGYHHAYLISSRLHTMIDYILFLATWAILDPFSGSQLTSDTPKCGFPKSFHFLVFNFSSDHYDLIFLLLNRGFIQYLAIHCFTSYFWCVIFRFRSRGGRMITSLNYISTQSESHFLGHLVPILCPCHLGHLITRGIMFPSFWHLCHLLHLLIILSHLITCLI